MHSDFEVRRACHADDGPRPLRHAQAARRILSRLLPLVATLLYRWRNAAFSTLAIGLAANFEGRATHDARATLRCWIASRARRFWRDVIAARFWLAERGRATAFRLAGVRNVTALFPWRALGAFDADRRYFALCRGSG